MGKLYVVGLGPGGKKDMTGAALAAMERSDTIFGYGVYLSLVEPLFPGKKLIQTPMTRELERCRLALSAAQEGGTVSLVCSGDAGVYGMAGPVCELAPAYPDAEIEIVPGVTAALSGAAALGAPLSHDFAVVSLSDLLTPWETIEKRLLLAAEADFCLALYNPASRRRADHLKRACALLLRYKSPLTACGWVRNIGREGQAQRVCTLSELQDEALDMFCTVFVGNRETTLAAGRLVTPRGYAGKAERNE